MCVGTECAMAVQGQPWSLILTPMESAYATFYSHSNLGRILPRFRDIAGFLHRVHRSEIQESPAVADKPARRLRKVCTVYVRAMGLL